MAETYESLKIPPHSIEAEQSVLGGLMLDNEAWMLIGDKLTELDFYRQDHRLIYRAISTLATQQKPLDVITLSEWLKENRQLDDAGGLAYLATMAKDTPSAANIAAYADIVREKSILRQLISVGTEIADSAFNTEGRESRELLDAAERKVFQIAEQGSRNTQSFRPLKGLMKLTLEHIEELSKLNSTITGVSTGYTDLDEMTSGLQKGDLIIVAGRPSMGKTTFSMNIAEYAAAHKKLPVAVFSMEMPAEQLTLRLLSSMGRVNQQNLRTGKLSDEDWPRIATAVKIFADVPMFIDDSAALSPNEVRSRARRLVREHGQLGLIVLDYLQLMQGNGKSENRTNEVSEISRSLKALAKELSVPVIVLSQLNRSLEQRPNKRPVMSDLRECVVGNTLVMLANGQRTPIRDLVGQTPTVLSVRPDGVVEPATTDLVWSVGKKQTIRVNLASGRTIECTQQHRLRTLWDWKEAGELQTGDRLALARHLPEPAEPLHWSEHELILLAHLVGDGSCKHLPPTLFQLPNTELALFLRHLWATDGCIHLGGKNSKPRIYFTTASELLIRDVAALLGRFGIIARIKQVSSADSEGWFTADISGAGQQRIFLDKIGAFGPRLEQATQLSALLKDVHGNTNVDTLPEEVFDYIRECMQQRGISHRQMASLRGTAYGGSAHFSFAPSRETLLSYADILNDDRLRTLAQDELFWDRVVSIEPTGEQEVFDLTVPGNACWLADGVVSHNSGAIEQDADVIMFVYRDEVYHPESAEKGSAEIIIAKQRNGPIGMCRLTFLGQYTRFENYTPDVYTQGFE